MSLLKVWSVDECLYLDYEDKDDFFSGKKSDSKFEIRERPFMMSDFRGDGGSEMTTKNTT